MRRTHQSSAFTLVELLVSIAIALLLILGVNTVFKVTAQTVGAGNSLLTATRDARTIFQTFLADLNSIDPVPAAGSTSGDGPFLVIRSDHVYAFRNPADQLSASSPTNPSTDANMFGGAQIPLPMLTARSHRIDRLGFFARGQFARQTTSDGKQFVSPTVGNEAYVYFGHADQPSTASLASGGTWYDPGVGTQTSNINNYYASDWMLSRMATILIATPTDANVRADGGGLSPFNLTSPAAATTDLAAMSIARYNLFSRSGGIQAYSWSQGASGTPGPNYGQDWWDQVINYRYMASPFVLSGNAITATNPKITPTTLAQCAPDLIRGCSQFVVEYAGNFYTKDLTKADGSASATLNDGSNTAQTYPVPDATGTLDYIQLGVNGPRQIRWYGFPRSTSGTAGSVSAANGDVVPLRDVLVGLNAAWTKDANGVVLADAEHFTNLPQSGNYWSGMSNAASYTAAWGPDVRHMPFPKMIRIIIEIDDHEGRLSQPQRYEFIYDVQQ